MENPRRSWSAEDSWPAWTPPQKCPFCLRGAAVRREPIEEIVEIRGCECSAYGVLRMSEFLVRHRWRELDVP
jgi:hypothetical protein